MRKIIIIALGLASLGALAGAQPTLALESGLAGTCRTHNIKCNTDTHGKQVCANTYINCLHSTVQLGGGASGPGPAPDQPQRRNIRPN